MADLQGLTNPFTKNENRMKRNTRDSRWIPLNDEQPIARKQAGPSKTYDLINQKSSHASQVPVISIDRDGSESYISDGQDVSVKTQNHLLLCTQTRQTSPISPLSFNQVSRRNSPVSATRPTNFSFVKEERKDPRATVFPHFPTTIAKSESRPKRDLADLFRSVKLIYDVGPDGEGQKVWKGYRQFRQEKKNHAPGKHEQSTALKDKEPRTMPRLAVSGLTAHPAAVPLVAAPPLRPLPTQSQSRSESRNNESSAGTVSTSSRDIPIGIANSIRHFVDVNKPLPPTPRLQSTPKRRREVGGATGHMVGIAAAGIQFPTQWQDADQDGEDDDSHPTTWWKERADKQTAKAHQALKAKISHPEPLAALSEGLTVNVALECGGVGGPAAATSTSVSHNGVTPMQTHNMKRKEVKPPPPLNMDFLKERTKGKQRAKDNAPTAHWRDMFDTIAYSTGKSAPAKGGKRRSSESSFGCQGLSDGSSRAFVQGAGPSTQSQMRKIHVGDEDMVPEPLFSNTCGADEKVRDTRFYQPYQGVLDDYSN